MSWVSTSAYSLLEQIGYRPRELYTFARNDQVWRMTGGTSLLNAIWGRVGTSYPPGLITRDAIGRSDESRSSTITVRVARTAAVADALREIHTAPMMLRIERWQDKAADHPVPIVLAYGPVANVRLVGGWVEMDLDTEETLFDVPFPTRLISRQNQWPVYSEFTGIEEGDFSFETTIAALTRSKITVTAKAGGTSDGYYDGGKIRVGAIGDHGEPMFVRKSTGLDFYISGRVIDGLSVGETITLVAGDDRSLTTARDKFGQQAVERFLGFDLLPTSDVLQTGLHDAEHYRSPYANPPTSAPGDPTGSLPPTPNITINQAVVETADDVTITLTVDDPDTNLTSIEARSNSVGFAPDWSSWATLTPAGHVYTFHANKGALDAVRVQIRITYIDPADSLSHQQTTDTTYHGGWGDQQTWAENNPSAGLVAFDFAALPGMAQVRAYLTCAQNDTLAPGGPETFDVGDSVKLAIDARSGPHTLTFPAKSYLDGAPVSAISVNGLKYFAMTVTFAPAFDWTTLP